MNFFIPLRMYLLASVMKSKDFKDRERRTEIAKVITALSSDNVEVQRHFLDFIESQGRTLNIYGEVAFCGIEEIKNQYDKFMGEFTIKPATHLPKQLLLDFILRNITGTVKKFIYLHNFLQNPFFFYMLVEIGLISYEQYKAVDYYIKLGLGKNIFRIQQPDYVHIIETIKSSLSKKIMSLDVINIDVSVLDPIFLITVN